LLPEIPHNEKELLERVATGEEQAFTLLFKHYRNKIYSIALKITNSEPIAEEILLDVFLKVWLKKEQLPALEHFSAWLFTITRNQVFSALKQMAVRRNAEDVVRLHEDKPEHISAEASLTDKEYQALLHQAILQLSPQQLKVYTLIKDKGLKREEAAQALNLSPETVKRHLSEAMHVIRGYCMARLDAYVVLIIIKQLL
jgi:RNA polymerase sigma-70 factor (family 1)